MPVPVVNAVARTECEAFVRCLPGVADEGRDRLRGGRLRGDRRQDGEDGERKGHGDWGARHSARGRGKLCEGWEPGWPARGARRDIGRRRYCQTPARQRRRPDLGCVRQHRPSQAGIVEGLARRVLKVDRVPLRAKFHIHTDF